MFGIITEIFNKFTDSFVNLICIIILLYVFRHICYKSRLDIINHRITALEQEKLKINLDLIEESDDSSSQNNEPILPLQNHITFPHFFILDKKNIRQKKLTNKTWKTTFVNPDLCLISTQLANFLQRKNGTCLEFSEAYDYLYQYIQDTNIINISDDLRLCKLFGISENEDYEYSDSIMVQVLEQMLEPHFKKIF